MTIKSELHNKISYKAIMWILMILFVVTLLPIAYCSFFDYANGDDLWEGASAYRVLASGGTVKEFITAVWQWAKIDYAGWEGNWSSIILWCLQPGIWGEKFYCITPWIALLHLCGGTSYFFFYYTKKFLNANGIYGAIVSLVACFFVIQYMPSVKNGVFWYTGMINYMVPYALSLMSFVWIDKFVEFGEKRYLVFTSVIFTYLGGAGYTPIVLAFEVLVLTIGIHLLSHNQERARRGSCLLVPLLLLMIGFIFSVTSPGNAVRGGESYRFDVLRIFTTIFECVRQGAVGGIKWIVTVRPLLLIGPLIVIMTWEQIDVTKIRFRLQYPILVICVLFLISCSLYAPGIYSQSEVSGGVPNTIYFTFLFIWIIGIIYLSCFFKAKMMQKGFLVINAQKVEKLRVIIVLIEILFCILTGRFLIGNMSAYICYDFIRSGQLSDFEFQMQERLKILHNPEISNVVLPEMNDQQGPFMHMPVIDDPEAYTNQATARYYGKESVVAIPRTEYYELYGYPEE